MCQIKRRSFLSSSAAAIGAGLLSGEHAHAAQTPAHARSLSSVHHRPNSVSLMVETANRFLAALEPDQRAKATFPFAIDERMNWAYIPKERQGLPLREMTPYQKHLASALLASGLSQTGYIKAVTIMSLEDVLKRIENATDEYRNPEKYYFSIFGMPSDSSLWGYRVEGHHVSQNYAVSNGVVVDGPSFFGSNPAEVRQGPRKGLRVLAAEKDLGFDMVRSLDEPQQKVAIVDAKAYSDIRTAASRKAALQGQPSGLSAGKMTPQQFDRLMALMEEYARNVAEDLAQRRLDQIDKAGRNIFFAWSGGIDQNGPHYYRVQASSFLIEYDNTQDQANHIHSVWRDFAGDFGYDLLQEHYQTSHEKK